MEDFIDLSFVGFVSLFLKLAPFTKVEESFNIQAIHDLVEYGLDTSQFDHVDFPGPVKRTFVGASIVTLFLKPLALLNVEDLQMCARGILAGFNCLALIRLRKCVKTVFPKASLWFAILQFFQFHTAYYASRTLPNFMALPLVNHALCYCVRGDFLTGITWLAFTGAVFRLEVGIFGLCIACIALLFGRVSHYAVVVRMAMGAMAGALLSLCVDSYFWNQLVLPELDSFWFNVIEGKSELWGTEPFAAYFTKYLPTIFIPPTALFFVIPGLVSKRVPSLKIIGLGSFLYVFIMSLQPHKELRFIIYAVPGICMLGASGIASTTSKRTVSSQLLLLLVMGLCALGIAASTFMAYASSFNYPGGEALESLNKIILQRGEPANVFIDIPAKMTGATLFGELPNAAYDKSETVITDWNYNYVITDKLLSSPWETAVSIKSFAGVKISNFLNILKDEKALSSIWQATLDEKSLRPVKEAIDSVIQLKESMYVYEKT